MPVEPGGMVAGLAEHWGILQYAMLEVAAVLRCHTSLGGSGNDGV